MIFAQNSDYSAFYFSVYVKKIYSITHITLFYSFKKVKGVKKFKIYSVWIEISTMVLLFFIMILQFCISEMYYDYLKLIIVIMSKIIS